MIAVGQQVYLPALRVAGIVRSVDPRSAGGAPCPCCGRGVGIEPLGESGSRIGVAPADCIAMSGGAAIAARGGVA